MIWQNQLKNVEGLDVVILYGSTARGDDDAESDVDIFVLVEDFTTKDNRELISLKVSEQYIDKEVNISLYTKSIFNKMIKEGSLFLWHLKLEGKVLYVGNERNIFSELVRFNSYQKNLDMYEKLFRDIKKSISSNEINGYDLSMLFFLCRNLSIVTCNKIGIPDFGRYSPYEKICKYLGFEPISFATYTYLSKWRLDYTRGIEEELEYPTKKQLNDIIDGVNILFRRCENIINEGNVNA